MTERVQVGGLQVAKALYDFINNEAIPGTGIDAAKFWAVAEAVINDLAPLFCGYLTFYQREHDEAEVRRFLAQRLERGESVLYMTTLSEPSAKMLRYLRPFSFFDPKLFNERIHVVDLDGAKAGQVKNWKVLESLAGKTSLVIDFGGGVKAEKDAQIILNSRHRS